MTLSVVLPKADIYRFFDWWLIYYYLSAVSINVVNRYLIIDSGSYVKNPDIKVRTNLTFNLNYLI